MNPEQWARVKALFNAVLDKPENQRTEFLTESTRDDPLLRDQVARLLNSHDQSDSFMEDSPVAAQTRDDEYSLPGSGRVGQYRLLREIGRGGMGTVYLAARDDGEFRHEVALKLVRRGMDTDLILRRFRYERQILADLDHPNIARLLDGGTTEDGRPYFVMEHIEGDPVDAFCKAHSLDVTQRLELFQNVCGAVQFAHQNLIVHRDIKPGNILVTPDGIPKLLDFGIAKLLDPAVDQSITAAAPGTMRALTPEYASPEQVRGDPITTGSDVYSLGILLYELLAGRRPYEINSRRPDDIARAVCETDPVPPSDAVSGSDSSRLRRRLSGDLDTIVLKAMHKEPARRYGSVQQLSDDVSRYLRGLPVTARRDTSRYRAAKFVRRNRFAVVAASAVVISLLAGLATTMWQAKAARDERGRAERRFAEVRDLATSFLFELHDAIAPLPGSTPVRGMLVKRALASLDGLAREAQGDTPLQRDLASAYERVGRVQGNSYNSNLGDTDGAIVSYRKSLEIRERLADDNPQSIDLQNELAQGYQGLSDMENTVGELARAAKGYERALAIRHALERRNPADGANRAAMADVYNSLGDTQGMDGYANLGDVPGALASYRQSVKLRDDLLKSDPHNADYRVGLGKSLMNLGFLKGSVGDTSGATEIRRAIALLEQTLAEDPNNTDKRLELLAGMVRLRFVLADAGEFKEAIAVDRETITQLNELLAADPSNSLFRRNLGATYNYLGRDLRGTGEAAAAVGAHRTALGIAERLGTADSKSSEHKHDIAISHFHIAEALSDTRDVRGALSEYRIAAAQKEKLRIIEPTNTRHGDDLALIYTGMGRVLTRTGQFAEAAPVIAQAISLATTAATRSATNMKAKMNMASAYSSAGSLHEAMTGSVPAEKRVSQWREARIFFSKSSAILQSIRSEHSLSVPQAKSLSNTRREIAVCDSALAGRSI